MGCTYGKRWAAAVSRAAGTDAAQVSEVARRTAERIERMLGKRGDTLEQGDSDYDELADISPYRPHRAATAGAQPLGP